MHRSGTYYFCQGVAIAAALAFFSCAGNPPEEISRVAAPAPDEVVARVVLIGDGGKPAVDFEPVLEALKSTIDDGDAPTSVVFLGDNLYPAGLPPATDKDYTEMERRLADQVDAVLATTATGYFIPGNHDWDDGGGNGWDRVRRQTEWVSERGNGRVSMIPGDGCPGPAVVDIGESVRVVAIDSQWWLHGHERPDDQGDGCPTFTRDAVVEQLSSAIANAGDRVVIVASHHPLVSSGTHGGYYPWRDHIFPLTNLASWAWLPLPIIGSIYPLSRMAGLTPQDQPNGRNEAYQNALWSIFREHPPTVFAAGHEHEVEVLKFPDGGCHVVSGAGYYRKTTPTRWRDEHGYKSDRPGFAVVDVLRDGRARVSVCEVDATGSRVEPYSTLLD